MAHSVVIAPNGGSSVEIGNAGLDGTGIWLTEGSADLFPVVSYDEAYAESSDTEGGRRMRSRPQNPVRSGKVNVGGRTAAAFRAFAKIWEQTIEAIRRDGGTLVYTPDTLVAITYDIESAEITTFPQDGVQIGKHITESEFQLTYLPYGRLASVTVAANVTSTDPIFSVPFDSTKVPGAVDALGKLVLTDLATQNRDHVEWGLDPDNQGNFLIDSAALDASGLAGATATRSGAYSGGSNNVIRATLTSSPLAICNTGAQTNTRRWKVKARVFGVGTGPIHVQLAWRVGEGQRTRDPNSIASLSTAQLGQFQEVDLGYIEIPTVIQGSQAWSGRIEAWTDNPGDTLDIDYIALIPAYRYGKARAVAPTTAPTLSAWDDFSQTAGALTGKTAKDGASVWTNVASDDADDFQVVTAAPRTADRTAVSDTNLDTGRLVQLGTTGYAAITAEVDAWGDSDIRSSGGSNTARAGLFARLTDISNFLTLHRCYVSGPGLALIKRVAGSNTILWSVSSPWLAFHAALTIRLSVNADGSWAVYYDVPGSGPTLRASGLDTDLATGGALASGKVGLYDSHNTSDALTRHYDNFAAFAPESPGHVINSGKSFWILDSINQREPSSGSVWGKVPSYEGAYLKLPCNRAGRIIVKGRRLDVDDYPDGNIADNLRADLEATPRVVILG